MKYAIDDKELARLEDLAGKAKQGAFAEKNLRNSLSVDGYGHDNAAYLAAIGKSGPALVAEVRRLRAELDAYIDEDQTKVITLQHKIMDVLRDKLEAWEWLEEVRACKPWNEHPYWEACGNSSKRGKIFDSAVDEYKLIYKAAREAVHADRE